MRFLRPVLALFLCALFTNAFAQSGHERAKELLDSLVVSARLPGLAVTVTSADSVLWSYSTGWADADQAVRMYPRTPVRIGSVSKLFTAELAWHGIRSGALDLDAPIGRYMTDLPSALEPITVRALLTHTAGIRHYSRKEYINATHYPDVQGALAVFAQDTLLSAPCSRYRYSSYGYVLLSAVIEKAMGGRFVDLMDSLMIGPMQLRSTFALNTGTEREMAVAYDQDSAAGYVPSPVVDLSDRWAAGGFASSAEDLAALLRSELQLGLGDSTALPVLYQRQSTCDGKPLKVALGWRIGNDAHGLYYHHGGDAVGGRAFVLMHPQLDIGIAMVSNLTFAPLDLRDALKLVQILAPTR